MGNSTYNTVIATAIFIQRDQVHGIRGSCEFGIGNRIMNVNPMAEGLQAADNVDNLGIAYIRDILLKSQP